MEKQVQKEYSLENLFLDIEKLYKKAHKSDYDFIKRGRAICCSPKIEDLMAFYLYNNSKELYFYTDIPISSKDHKNPFYPDILVLNKNDEIVSMFDIKTDMGWNRSGLELMCAARKEKLSRLKKYESKIMKGKKSIKITKSTGYYIIIISGKNWKDGWESEVEQLQRKYKKSKPYVLTS